MKFCWIRHFFSLWILVFGWNLFFCQIFLGWKYFLGWKFFLGQQIFWSENFFGQQYFWSKFFCVIIFLGSKIFLGLDFFWVGIFFWVVKFFWVRHLHTQDPPLSPPSILSEIFRCTCLQNRLQTSATSSARTPLGPKRRTSWG